jgi:prepilin-type N-terminal cleavage/methylation domain-containing protein
VKALNQNAGTFRSNRMRGVECCYSRSGFTLVEILVVVLIIGILAAAASLTLLTRARSATLADVTRRIAFLDATTRHTARRSGQAERIVVDLDKGQIISQELPIDAAEDVRLDDSNWTQRIQLPKGFRVDHARLIDQATNGSSGMSTRIESLTAPDALGQTTGQLTLSCSADGYTPSYAISVTGPQSQRRWIVLLGLTGQTLVAADDQQVRSLLSLKSWQPRSGTAANTREQADGR